MAIGSPTSGAERCGMESTAVPGSVGTLRYAAALFLLGALLFFAIWLYDDPRYGRDFSFAAVSGTCFGIVLQRSRFCFFCIFNDLLRRKDSRPLLGLIAAFSAGSLGHAVVFTAWLSDARAGYLPPIAHIGPVSWVLVVGSILFGLGMALSGSCISAHLYRLGEGSLLAPLALAGTLAGFLGGLLSWNFFYVQALAGAQPVWIPRYFGYSVAIALQLALFLAATCVLARFVRRESPPLVEERAAPLQETLRAAFVRRWPAWIGGVAVAALATLTLLRGESLGVVPELGRCSRRIADAWQWLPARMEGLDANTGCQAVASATAISRNGIFVIALVAGALCAALIAGQFRPKLPTVKEALAALIGGAFLGFGAFLSGGCTIGTMLTGIMAFSLSGWIFLAGMLTGLAAALPLRKRLGLEAPMQSGK